MVLAGIAVVFLLFGITGVLQAALVNIGTATYEGGSYNLIYDADGPLGPITWLDYSNKSPSLEKQIVWAATLGDKLTVTLNPIYTTNINWLIDWRLPHPGKTFKSDDNIITSEMGHLYYDELKLKSSFDQNYEEVSDDELNASEFNNLQALPYYYGTNVDGFEELFFMEYGTQHSLPRSMTTGVLGIAVHSGQVSMVPAPGTVWLFGFGVMGLVVFGWGKKNLV